MLYIRETDQGIIFRVMVQPRSAKNAIAGIYGDALRVRLTSPPVEGAANKACVKFLAGLLGVPKSSLEIISGQTSRNKQLLCRMAPDSRQRAELKKRILALPEG